MNIGMVILNQSIKKMQNYAMWIQIVLMIILKLNHIKTEDVYEDIPNDVKKWFNTSNYNKGKRTLPRVTNKKVISLMKDELGGKIMPEFVALIPKTYSSLMDHNNTKKKAKGTKTCVIERILKFNDHKNCLFMKEIILKSKQRFKIEAHCVHTEEINKITNF